MTDRSNPHGDDSPGSTGAGSEAAEGIHGATTNRDPADRSSAEHAPSGSDDDRAGSEPLVDRETEHRSGYGGSGGKPVRSSDQRKAEGS
jgi:hypothetical protein